MAWMIPVRAGVIRTLPFFKKMGGWLAAEYGLSVIVEWVSGYKMSPHLVEGTGFLIKWGFGKIEDLFAFPADGVDSKSVGEDVLTSINTFIRKKVAADPNWMPGANSALTPEQLLLVESKIESYDTDDSGRPVVVTESGTVPSEIFFSVDYLVNVSEQLQEEKAKARGRAKSQGRVALTVVAVALTVRGLMWYSKQGRR